MILALATSLVTFAQDDDRSAKTPAEKAALRTTEMTSDLGLTADQVVKVGKINQVHMLAMHDAKLIEDKTMREKRKELLKANRDEALKQVLTAPQYEKMVKMRDDKRAAEKAEKEKKHKEKDTEGKGKEKKDKG